MSISLKKLAERNAVFEGVKLSLSDRLRELVALYEDSRRLSPFQPSPLVKSFRSFKEYHAWKKTQKNPWYW